MRRQERAVTDAHRIEALLSAADCCRIGFYDHGEVYIVPLSFGYAYHDDRLTLYFHGAKEGRKRELLKDAPSVGFELDADYQLVEAETGCGCSARFISMIGNGQASVVETRAEKERGLTAIMRRSTGRDCWRFSEEMLEAVCVFKVEATSFSCKAHL